MVYTKGQWLWHTGYRIVVQYVCDAGGGIHIVTAAPLDYVDDGVREVRLLDLATHAAAPANHSHVEVARQ